MAKTQTCLPAVVSVELFLQKAVTYCVFMYTTFYQTGGQSRMLNVVPLCDWA